MSDERRPPAVSIIVGFRNWGLNRLALSIESIAKSLGDLSHEIIVSDFGSADRAGNKASIEALGAKYVFTESAVWSRARALNTGIDRARASVIMCTDADMLFSPGTLRSVYEALSAPSSAVFIQCRDLPREWDADGVRENGVDWDRFGEVSSLRPRWGMGGLVAFQRSAFDEVRGFDDRMEIYGGEDLDFAQRLQRNGVRIVWLDRPDVRMYHIWHPSSSVNASEDAASKTAVQANTKIVEKDPSVLRNLTKVRAHVVGPEVSVVISTFNRSQVLEESMASVLAQSFADFELIVVDDGSTDNTKMVVDSFRDERIRYVAQPNAGISAARNHGTDIARGRYIAVHDDDDLMLPTRLASSLSAIRGGVTASFGSWVNFADSDGELQLNVSKKEFDASVAWGIGYAPGHSTWLVPTELIRTARYDEKLSSAVDHNLATRLMSSGVRWAHTGSILFLRRKHADQITVHDGGNQEQAAILTRRWLVSQDSASYREQLTEEGMNKRWPKLREKDNLEQLMVPWLPDHLVVRDVVVRGDFSQIAQKISPRTAVQSELVTVDSSGAEVGRSVVLHGASWRDLATLRQNGMIFSVTGARRKSASLPPVSRSRAIQGSVQGFLNTAAEGSGRELGILVLAVGARAKDVDGWSFEGRVSVRGRRRERIYLFEPASNRHARSLINELNGHGVEFVSMLGAPGAGVDQAVYLGDSGSHQ